MNLEMNQQLSLFHLLYPRVGTVLETAKGVVQISDGIMQILLSD